MNEAGSRPGGATVRGFLAGATGVGKTEVGLYAARRLGLEILGVDSRQIYRRLEIGTAKPTPAERASVRHHLLDLLEPDETLSAGRYLDLFREALDDMGGRGAAGLAVGGTGLYLDACLGRLHPLPGRSETIRRRLRREEEQGGAGTLHRRLLAIDPDSGARIAPRDLQRVVRALEVAERTGRTLSSWFREVPRSVLPAATPVFHLSRDRDDLRRRIEERCRRMVEAGLAEEVRGLLDSGLSPEAPGLRTIGYGEWIGWIEGRWSREKAFERLLRNTWRAARRQETWLRNRHPRRLVIRIEPGETAARAGERLLAALAARGAAPCRGGEPA